MAAAVGGLRVLGPANRAEPLARAGRRLVVRAAISLCRGEKALTWYRTPRRSLTPARYVLRVVTSQVKMVKGVCRILLL